MTTYARTVDLPAELTTRALTTADATARQNHPEVTGEAA